MWLLTLKLWHFLLSCCCFELLQLWRSWIFMRWSFLNQSAALRQDAASSCNHSRTGSGWFTFTIRLLPMTSLNSSIVSLQAVLYECRHTSNIYFRAAVDVFLSRIARFFLVRWNWNIFVFWWNVLFLTFHRNIINPNINQQIHWQWKQT